LKNFCLQIKTILLTTRNYVLAG